METRFIPGLVMLSVMVAIFASYVAMNLAHSVTHSQGRAKGLWLAGGALALGTGIWSMHFVGMLAFEMPGMTMAYDIPLLILSIIVAIGASALALYIVSQPLVPVSSLISGGIAMAAGIAGMHYIGMYSMRMDAYIRWNLFFVVLSVIIALVASLAALKILVTLRDKSDRLKPVLLASTLMGFAISGMHYTGMFAATFIHMKKEDLGRSDILVSSGLTMSVIAMTLLILGLALLGSIGQRVLTHLKKQSEEYVVTSEERYRLLIQAVKDYAIFMLDPQGYITSWNSGAERITGYRTEDIIGKHFAILYTKYDLDINYPSQELKIAAAKGHFETEGQRVRKDGSTFWANVVISPVFDAGKNLTGFSKVARDITALKEAEDQMRKLNEDLEKRVQSRTLELQRREAQLRSITNALPVLVGQVDKDERIQFANDVFCKWFGFTTDSVIGMSMREVFGEPRYSANEPYIKNVLRGNITQYERLSISNGQAKMLNITFVPEFDGSGGVTGFVLVANDISKHKEIEAELKKAKDEAEVANMTKSAFLANMSHEIRTPLGAVLGFSELIMNEDLQPAERENNIEVIKRNGQLLSNIINDILDLSKVEAGKLETEKIDVPFHEIMSEMGSIHNLEAAEKGIEFRISLEGEIPSVIQTDPTRLRQILLNIIGNAIKFTVRGHVYVTVKMIDQDGDPKLAFVIEDTGEGIRTEHTSKLFTPFTQADVSTTRRFGGTGLGLVLSKKLANQLGGDIVLLKSVPHEGSTFLITIDAGHPQGNAATSNLLPLKSKTVSNEQNVSLKNLKVLLVDDSHENQILIKTYLNVAGAIVETANNGREAVEKALKGDFDLILMDLQMPEMDGYQATDELRKKNFKKPIIALTAHAMKEDRRRCLESGFNEHLTKPVDRRSLLHTIAEFSA